MNIKRVPIDQVKTWEENPRNIKTEDFERLKKQIKELGVYKPMIACPKNGGYTVLGGNMRLRALKELGIKEVDISIVHPKSKAEKIKYALSDNDRAGEYEEEKLAELVYPYMQDIDLEEFKIDLEEPISLKDVIEGYGPNLDGSEDETPDIDDSPAITKKGDLYKFGRHRLICGDATDQKDLERLMGNETVNMVFSSPPYNMAGDRYRNYDDNLKSQEYIDFNLNVINNIRKYLRGFLFWNISYNKNARWEWIEIFYRITKETGLRFLEKIVWDKGHGTPITSRKQLTRQYEDILLAGTETEIESDLVEGYVGTTEKGYSFNKKTLKGVTNYWRITTDSTQLKDLTACYPVALPVKGILLMTKMQDKVLDPFLGSGSTLIACEKTNRTCYGIEIDPKYCDVIIKRYADYTGTPEEKLRGTVEHG